eukprot:scaffold10745_cov25-Cyclotella_meneghiniana.AAC.3
MMVMTSNKQRTTKANHLSCIALLYLLQCCDAFSTSHLSSRTIPMRQIYPRGNTRLLMNKDTENEIDSNEQTSTKNDEPDTSYSWEELQADPELSQLERNAATQRRNSMLLPQRISKAAGVLAWGFVIVGFILNTLGYAYIADPSGGIGIGTLNERDFQRELVRSSRTVEKLDTKTNGIGYDVQNK